ncbi:putative porin [Shewanella waksmanii]|uniref:putative porin n=1 Tax=Shewanella waksmanii TaxID=213783 RepID=UPI0004AFF2AC|nr:putative porin [Shewanella waksmanii]
MRKPAKYPIIAIAMLAVPSLVLANTGQFNHQADLSYINNDNIDSYLSGSDLWQVNYRYYLDEVDVANGPYALNGFLAQSSQFGAFYTAQQDSLSGGAKADSDFYGVDATYVFDNGWFVGGRYQQSKPAQLSNTFSQDSDEYGLSLGYYLNDNASITVFYSNESQDDSYKTLDNFINREEKTIDGFGIEYRHFIRFETTAGIDFYLVGEKQDIEQTNLSHWQSSPTTSQYQADVYVVSASLDWFINNSWSLGAHYMWRDLSYEYNSDRNNGYYESGSNSIDQLSLNTAYWWQFSDHLAAQFHAEQFFGDRYDGTLEGFSAGASLIGRF